jgi:Tfp pilus assembly protein PilO
MLELFVSLGWKDNKFDTAVNFGPLNQYIQKMEKIESKLEHQASAKRRQDEEEDAAMEAKKQQLRQFDDRFEEMFKDLATPQQEQAVMDKVRGLLEAEIQHFRKLHPETLATDPHAPKRTTIPHPIQIAGDVTDISEANVIEMTETCYTPVTPCQSADWGSFVHEPALPKV